MGFVFPGEGVRPVAFLDDIEQVAYFPVLAIDGECVYGPSSYDEINKRRWVRNDNQRAKNQKTVERQKAL
jgi:hypothetical protein